MSTNEELVVLIQEGHNELLSVLWDQTNRLLIMIARRLYCINSNRLKAAGVELEDLIQETYFAMIDAAIAYKPNGAFKFNSYLKRNIQNRIRSTIGRPNDAVLRADSLEKPITGDKDESLTLGEVIPDPDSEVEIIGVIENEYQRQLHYDLELCLDRLPASEKESITEHFYNNESFQTIAEKHKTTAKTELNLFNSGFRKLRHPKPLQTLRLFINKHK